MINTLDEAKAFDIRNNNTTFTFEAFGEDTSCGGICDAVERPHLGHFSGNAEEVFTHCSSLKHWNSWGGGGRIKIYLPPVIYRIPKINK